MACVMTGQGDALTDGLQGCKVSDAALKVALGLAEKTGETVYLEDDDGLWAVSPDGSVEPVEAVC